MNYQYAFANLVKGGCVLGGVQNVDDNYRLLRGVPLAATFPPAARLDMDQDFGMRLADIVKNGSALFVVSDAARALIEREAPKNNEILPVRIHDKNGKQVPKPYFIVHQVELQDCIDLGATVATRNPINPDIFIDVEHLRIDERRIDPDLTLLRPRYLPTMLLVRRDLAIKLLAAGVTGVEFGELDAFDQFETL